MNLLKTTTMSAIASGLLVLGLGASSPSHATFYVDLSPSGACMASSGPGADNFYFSPIRAQNTASVSHYIVCDLTMVRRTSTTEPTSMNLHFYNPHSTARTVDCVVVATHNNVPSFTATYSFSDSVSPNGVEDSVGLGAAEIPTPTDLGQTHMALSCLIPAGVGVGTISINSPGTIAP